MSSQIPNIPIIYEDEDLLVINKPPGVVVNRSHTQKEPTVQDWVEEYLGDRSQVSGFRTSDLSTSALSVSQQSLNTPPSPKATEGHSNHESLYGDPIETFKERSGIVHRLDKETSGVLLIAKNPETLMDCMAQFKARTTQKKYIALVHGKVQPNSGEINLPIGRNPRMRMQFAVVEEGKESSTEYNVLNYYPTLNIEKILEEKKKQETEGAKVADFYFKQIQGMTKNFRKATKMYQGFSLIEAFPKTGRTHQIRVHLAHVHHPVVGDKMYSGNKRRLMDSVWCPRTFLHSSWLKIYSTRRKGELEFHAPLSEDLEKVLGFLRM